MNIEFDCEEIRKWTFAKNSFSSTEEVFGYFEDGLHKNGPWRSPIEEINRYLSPEEELEFKKNSIWRNSDLNAGCDWSYFEIVHRLKIWMSPNHKKLQIFSATKMSLFWINGLTVILCFTKFFVCVWIIETVNTEHWLDIS